MSKRLVDCIDISSESDNDEQREERSTKLEKFEEPLYPLALEGRVQCTPYEECSNSKLKEFNWISFSELIQAKLLVKGVFSSMVIDWPWFLLHFPNFNQNLLIITDYDRPREVPGTFQLPNLPQYSSTVRVHHPPFYNTFFGKMHSKVMCLFYPDRLRIVISSANLVEYDYNKVQNIVFYQDFPKLSVAIREEQNDNYPAMITELLEMFKKMNVQEDSFYSYFKDYDFQKANAKIVVSVPGNYSKIKIQAQPSGIQHLSVQVNSLISSILPSSLLSTLSTLDYHLEYQASSIGSITEDWLSVFTEHALGCSSLFKYKEKISQFPPIKIVYPTLRTVNDSMVGPLGFRTVFCQEKFLKKEAFPISKFCDSLGIYSIICMHSKILTLYVELDMEEEASREKKRVPLYHYLGSHNISGAAWGSWNKAKSSKMIRNYELGVLIPGVRSPKGATKWEELIEEPFCLPFISPPEPYDLKEDEPWMQDKHLC